jgi:hypothetical protein
VLGLDFIMLSLLKVSQQLSKGPASNTTLSIRLGCIYDHGDGLKFCESISQAPKDSNIVVGAVMKIPQLDGKSPQVFSRFFPGEMVGDLFVPGQRISSANGEFIPAACIRSGKKYKNKFLSKVSWIKLIFQRLIRSNFYLASSSIVEISWLGNL